MECRSGNSDGGRRLPAALNVWAPKDAENAPVIMYIHGGGNNSGGASCDVYDGEEIAKKGVVYVSINYR